MPCSNYYQRKFTNCEDCKSWWCEQQGMEPPSLNNPNRIGVMPIPEDPWKYEEENNPHILVEHKK